MSQTSAVIIYLNMWIMCFHVTVTVYREYRMYLNEINTGVVCIRDAVRIWDAWTRAYRYIPRQLKYVTWRQETTEQKHINPTAHSHTQDTISWLNVLLRKHQQQHAFYLFSIQIWFSPGLTGTCAPLALTPCALIEYGRLALFLNVITIISPTSALIIGPTEEKNPLCWLQSFLGQTWHSVQLTQKLTQNS